MKGSEEYLHWTSRFAKSRDLWRNGVVLIFGDQNRQMFQNYGDVFSTPEDSATQKTF
jgi:hypothetical protein